MDLEHVGALTGSGRRRHRQTRHLPLALPGQAGWLAAAALAGRQAAATGRLAAAAPGSCHPLFPWIKQSNPHVISEFWSLIMKSSVVLVDMDSSSSKLRISKHKKMTLCSVLCNANQTR